MFLTYHQTIFKQATKNLHQTLYLSEKTLLLDLTCFLFLVEAVFELQAKVRLNETHSKKNLTPTLSLT
jgi:hypothetical protein